MSKVIKMSLKEILKKTGIILASANEISYICDDQEVIDEFISKFKGNSSNNQEVKKFLIEHEEYINKEKFILLTVRNYKIGIELFDESMGELPNTDIISNFSKQMVLRKQNECLENAIKIGKGIDTRLTYYGYDKDDKRYKITVVDSKKVIDGRKEYSKAIKRFDEVDSNFKDGDSENDFGMECVLQSLLLTDLYNVFPDEQFGARIRMMILENYMIKTGLKTMQEIENLRMSGSLEEYDKATEGVKIDKKLFSMVKETLREYAEYIDMDKLLIISAYRFCDALEDNTISKELQPVAKEILEGILDNIKDKSINVSGKLQKKVGDTYKEIEVNFDIKEMKKYLSRFAGNSYLTLSQIEEYKEQINSRKLNLTNIPKECVDVVFSEQELQQISLLSPENLLYVSQKYNWDGTKIIDLYEKDQISLESINRIKGYIDLSNTVSLEKLNSYYKSSKQMQNDETNINYKKYLELYKEIFINVENEKVQHENSNQIMECIVETFEGDEYNEAVKEYFKAGLITLDIIADWSNESFITELLNDGQISLEDMKVLVAKGKILSVCLENKCRELINNTNIEYAERLRLIKSGLIKEEDIFELYKRNLIFESDLRQLAEEKIIGSRETQRIINSRTMEELEKNSAIILTGLDTLEKKHNDIYTSDNSNSDDLVERKLTEKFIIDPNERERFLRLLKAYRANTDLNEDSPFYNYEFYVIPDESGTIGLNSVVIAERYYEDKDTETKFATNNATYFFKYKDLMVLSNLRKSEIAKEREDIVFTAKHIVANEKRDGSWAKSVITSLAKTMLSSDLGEYSKENQQMIIRQKMMEIYTPKELKEILQMAVDIDIGQYLCVIEEPVVTKKRKPKNISDDTESR